MPTPEMIEKEKRKELIILRNIHEQALELLSLPSFGIFTKSRKLISLMAQNKVADYCEKTNRLAISLDHARTCLEIAAENVATKRPFLLGSNSYSVGGAPSLIETGVFRETIKGKLYEPVSRPATLKDAEEAIRIISHYQDIFQIGDSPVKPVYPRIKQGPSYYRYRLAKMLDEILHEETIRDLGVAELDDKQILEFLEERFMHWFDPIDSPLRANDELIEKLLRSVMLGANVAIASMPQGTINAPHTPYGLAVQSRAEIYAGIVFAVTANKNAFCVYAAYPCPTDYITGEMIHGSLEHNLMCALEARINIEITGLATDQAGGTNDQEFTTDRFGNLNEKLFRQGDMGRRLITAAKVRRLRQPCGFVKNTGIFNLGNLIIEANLIREHRKELQMKKDKGESIPQIDILCLTEDPDALCVIVEQVERGVGFKENCYHTTQTMMWWSEWIRNLRNFYRDSPEVLELFPEDLQNSKILY